LPSNAIILTHKLQYFFYLYFILTKQLIKVPYNMKVRGSCVWTMQCGFRILHSETAQDLGVLASLKMIAVC